MFAIACLLIGYLMGSLMTAELAARLKTGRGMAAAGRGNPGMAHAWARLGPAWGVAVLAGDLAKTAAACLVCEYVFFPELGMRAALYAGLGAVIGHDFPLYHGFRGGKGVAATAMMALCVSPTLALLVYAGGAVAMLLSRYLAVGSATIAALLPLLAALMGMGGEATVLLALSGGLMLLRHAPNFRRMRQGQEQSFGLRRPSSLSR